MADIYTRAKRSEVMSRVRGRGNRRTELALISVFRKAGIIGWRRNLPMFGKPDLVFRRQRLAVFVDGCFWHGCPKHATWPAHRAAWWRRKLEGNRARDRKVNRALRATGWRVVRIWEHELPKRGTRNAERGTDRTQRGTRNAERGMARIRKALAAASQG